MPAADIEIVTVPSFVGLPLILRPIAEAPVSPGVCFGPCLLGPGNDSDWVIGHWDGEGWFSDANGTKLLAPAYWVLLPLTQRGAKQVACRRAADIEELIADCEYERAAKLLDVLADELHALRDRPRRQAER